MKTIFKKPRDIFAHKKPIYKNLFWFIQKCHRFEGTNPSLSPSFQQFGQIFRAKDDLREHVVAEYEDFSSPTPREGHEETLVETSSSKPRCQRVNQVLEKIHELEVLEREIKRNNAVSTKRNKELHNFVLEMREMYVMLKRRNIIFMQENIKLYRMIRLLWL